MSVPDVTTKGFERIGKGKIVVPPTQSQVHLQFAQNPAPIQKLQKN